MVRVGKSHDEDLNPDLFVEEFRFTCLLEPVLGGGRNQIIAIGFPFAAAALKTTPPWDVAGSCFEIN